MRKTITLINGSLGGRQGNTRAVLTPLLRFLEAHAQLVELELATALPSVQELAPLFASSDGFIFATGTYWDSWGSPLQAFLEAVTPLEGSPALLGKPVAIVVTMHAVGGKGVLSRLQGVLSTLGFSIPPMSGMVYSLAMMLAAQHPSSEAAHALADFWQPGDLEFIGHNLLEAVSGGKAFRAWTLDKEDPRRRWIPG